ncbi:MAG TPA: hypothetical protein VHO25_02075 [Polyangiaceae bacterium]|nr:hypothetical protein [Polyangiaceae bacterium]
MATKTFMNELCGFVACALLAGCAVDTEGLVFDDDAYERLLDPNGDEGDGDGTAADAGDAGDGGNGTGMTGDGDVPGDGDVMPDGGDGGLSPDCDDEGELRCTPNGVLETCNGELFEETDDCGSEGRCSASRGICLNCEPASFRCAQDKLEQCDLEGEAFHTVATCAGADACLADGLRGGCQVCEVDALSCSGFLPIDGDGGEGDSSLHPTSDLLTCVGDGTELTVSDTCTLETSYCDDQNGTCLACAPGTSACFGATLVPCLEDGSGYDHNAGQDCECRNACDADNQQCTVTDCSRLNQVQCSGAGALQACGPSGFWENVDNCGSQAMCDDSYAFCQVCVPNSSYCSGQYLMQCNGLGTAYVQARDCGPGAGACVDNGEDDYCNSGCDGVNIYDICNESRQVVHCNPGGESTTNCAGACEDAACVDCFPGEYRCAAGNELEQCNASGSGWTSVDDCDTGNRSCSDRVGACLTAVPGSYYCDDASQQVIHVQADGSEVMYDQCHGNERCDISQGGCVLSFCAPDELLCDGDGLVQCNSTGDDWDDVERCASGSMCLDGLGCLEPVAIAAGEAHTCVIAVPSGMPAGTQGVAMCWGAGDQGQLGTGAPVLADTSAARRVIFDIGETELGVDHFLFPAFTDVCAGRDFSCAKFVDMEGGTDELIACWGSNALGQLGTDNDSAGPFDHVTQAVTDGIGNGTDPEIVGLTQMTCGASFACALHANGTAYCWGANNHGQLGVSSEEPLLRLATPIEGHDFVQLSAGAQHACGIKADNSVWCWGAGARGRLGNDAEDDSNEPVEIADLSAKKTLLPMLGADFSVLVGSDTTVNSWGGNVLGQLGTGDTMGSLVPVQVMDLNAPDLSGLSLGPTAQHACAIEEGLLSCWGSNALGQLATGDKLDRNVPTITAMDGSMPALTIADLPNAVAVGGAHTCVIASDKQVYCWGHNGRGQLGNALAENPQLSPIAVDFP